MVADLERSKFERVGSVYIIFVYCIKLTRWKREKKLVYSVRLGFMWPTVYTVLVFSCTRITP